MLPFSFEWVWDMGHMVFHGGLWYALSVIGMGMTFVIIKIGCRYHAGKRQRPSSLGLLF
jgi:hypothetical protein